MQRDQGELACFTESFPNLNFRGPGFVEIIINYKFRIFISQQCNTNNLILLIIIIIIITTVYIYSITHYKAKENFSLKKNVVNY